MQQLLSDVITLLSASPVEAADQIDTIREFLAAFPVSALQVLQEEEAKSLRGSMRRLYGQRSPANRPLGALLQRWIATTSRDRIKEAFGEHDITPPEMVTILSLADPQQHDERAIQRMVARMMRENRWSQLIDVYHFAQGIEPTTELDIEVVGALRRSNAVPSNSERTLWPYLEATRRTSWEGARGLIERLLRESDRTTALAAAIVPRLRPGPPQERVESILRNYVLPETVASSLRQYVQQQSEETR